MPTRPPLERPPEVLSPVQIAQLLETLRRVDKRGDEMQGDVKSLKDDMSAVKTDIALINQRVEGLDAGEMAAERERFKALSEKFDALVPRFAKLEERLTKAEEKAAEQSGGAKVIAHIVMSALAIGLSTLAFFLR